MKILYTNSYYYPDVPGGAEVMMRSMVEAISALGHDISVMTTAAGDDTGSIDGFPVYRLRPRNMYWKLPNDVKPAWQKVIWHGVDRDNPFIRSAIRAVLTKVKPDVIASNALPGLSIALWREAKALGIPVAQILHDYYLMCPSMSMYKAGRNCTEICALCRFFRGPHAEQSSGVGAVVGVSNAVLNAHLKHGLFSRTPIKRVIYNARDLPKPQPRQQAVSKSGEIVFGFIGTISEVKGVEPLIHAFMQARRTNPPISLVIAGTGEKCFVDRLKELAPSDAVRFIGRADPISFFKEMDVCVVPSRWNDPLPTVVFEALSQGVPVVGATRGGIPEMVTDGVNGVLFDPDEEGSLVEAISKMAKNRSLIDEYSSNAVSSAGKFTKIDRMSQEYAGLFKELTRG